MFVAIVSTGAVSGRYSSRELTIFPLVLGNCPAMRGSRWQAKSTALANALNSASHNVMRFVPIEQFQVQVATGFIGESLEKLPRQPEPERAGHVLLLFGFGELLLDARLVHPAPDQVRPAAEIDHAPRQAFIHRHVRFAR